MLTDKQPPAIVRGLDRQAEIVIGSGQITRSHDEPRTPVAALAFVAFVERAII